MSDTAANMREVQTCLKQFKSCYQFSFTGTPIFPENASGAQATASVFGRDLHSYDIIDEKVLKFKVDYNDVRTRYNHEAASVSEDQLVCG